MLFLIAPFIGFFFISSDFQNTSEDLKFPTNILEETVDQLYDEVTNLEDRIIEMGLTLENQKEVFHVQDDQISELSKLSDSQRELSDDIYEQKILKMLGSPIKTHISDRTEIKIFKLAELGYRGYIAKIKLFDPTAFKVVLAKDQLGASETTSQAAKRTNAILAINGGGFYREKKNGKVYTHLIGNTVIDGKLVEPFNGYPGDLFFAGINKKGQVIGTIPHKEKDLLDLDPYQGVSFLPILLKNGEKLELPPEWKKTRHPRTIIGKYANDDLIVIVIDGRQGNWSIGITLERLQDKLLELGVKDAYNLDGGGSSAMYYDGKILNKPSDGRERPVVNNIVILP